MDNYLEEDFFYDKDFNKIEDVAIAGNCMQQLIAIVMKKYLKRRHIPFAIYLNDLSFNIKKDSQGYLSRSAIRSNIIFVNQEYYKKRISIIKDDLAASLNLISDALNTYGYAILRTVDAYLPFSIYYNNTYDVTLFQETGHVLMIVNEDNDNYYYIEQLSEVNKDLFVHVESRKDIGVCPKRVFYKSLAKYTKVITIDFNEEYIVNAGKNVSEIIKESIEHYYNNSVVRTDIDENTQIIGGRSAIYYFEEAYRSKRLVLDKKVYNVALKGYCEVDVGRELMNGATGIVNRRILLRHCLEDDKLNESYIRMVHYICKSIDAWEQFKNRIMVKYCRKDYEIEEDDFKYIKGIIDAEEEMFSALKEIVNSKGE